MLVSSLLVLLGAFASWTQTTLLVVNDRNNTTTTVVTANATESIIGTDDSLRSFLPTEDPATFLEYVADNDSTTAAPGDPSTCGGLCPSFHVEEIRPSYEVRSYPPAYWLSTVVFAENRVLAELEGFEKIREYLGGKNEEGLRINLTTPLLTQIKYQPDPSGRKEPKEFTLSLYIPLSRNGSEPPYPLINDVLIESTDERLVFTQRFYAHMWQVSDRHVRARAARMMTSLGDNGEAFLGKYIYLATYDRSQLYNQTLYEIWIFASRFRDASMIRPRVKPVDPPMSRITAKTKKRLCRGMECPHFDVLRSYKYGIQKRRYYDAKLASYTLEECQFSQTSLWKGFVPLHLYRHGVNSHLEMIESTRPIGIVYVKESTSNDSSANNSCLYNFTVSFYLPERLHANPPTTGSGGPRIRIASIDDLIVYVGPVGGYVLVDPANIRLHVQHLADRLRRFQVCFRDDEYYVAVYDFITRFHGRLNEIWLVAKSCPSDGNSLHGV